MSNRSNAERQARFRARRAARIANLEAKAEHVDELEARVKRLQADVAKWKGLARCQN
jgi:hypothetical protein